MSTFKNRFDRWCNNKLPKLIGCAVTSSIIVGGFFGLAVYSETLVWSDAFKLVQEGLISVGLLTVVMYWIMKDEEF